jgi:hypothetical protein
MPPSDLIESRVAEAFAAYSVETTDAVHVRIEGALTDDAEQGLCPLSQWLVLQVTDGFPHRGKTGEDQLIEHMTSLKLLGHLVEPLRSL